MDENISKVDILNRTDFVERLINIVQILANSKQGCTFSIDGVWGSGKSFILQMLDKQLSIFQSEEWADDKYIVFHYNCWQYDYYDEPAVAIVAAIKDEITKHNSLFEKQGTAIKEIVQTITGLVLDLADKSISNKLGFSPKALYSRFNGVKASIEEKEVAENKFDIYYDFKSTLEKTKEELSKLAEQKTVVLIVDELDRCMPEYAIKVLERLHHLFGEDSKVIVILAIDRTQLERTVNLIFGNTDSKNASQICDNYLKKFINFSVQLDSGVISEDFWARFPLILKHYDIISTEPDVFLNELPMNLFKGLDVRTQTRILEKMVTLHHLTFDSANEVAVLYFELIYQAIAERAALSINLRWLTDLMIDTRTYKFNNALDNNLFNYFKKLLVFCDTMRYGTGQNANRRVLSDSTIGIAFWLLGSLSTPTLNQNPFEIENANKYSYLLEPAKNFHKLAQLIR